MAKEITNKLLKQAIADAEAVRETAVANAKLVLEESITPQIRDMISRRLRVEAENSEEEDVDEKEVDGDEDTVTEGEDVKKAKETPHEDGDPVGSSEMPADSSTIGGGDNKEPSDDSFDSSEVGDGPEGKSDGSTDWYDDWSEGDFDLESVIKELEEDIAALSGDSLSEAEELDETETAADPNKFADASLKMDNADLDHKEEIPGDSGDEESDDEEFDLEEMLAELEADDDELSTQDGDEEKQRMAADLARLKDEVAQYREAVNILRGRLQEVNLLNAKLLFTSKMFKKDGLTNEQKVRIVETFDRATTVREVKLVYATLVENLSAAAKTFNSSRKKVVAEGLASKATPGTAPKQEVIVENENKIAKRLQELAGLI